MASSTPAEQQPCGIRAFLQAPVSANDRVQEHGQHEPRMKVSAPPYRPVKDFQEREGRRWQLPRDFLAWHTLIAEEGNIWEGID